MGVLGTTDNVAIGIEVERVGLAVVLDVHGIIRAKNEAAVGVVLGAVDGDSLSIEQIGSASQLASLGVSSSNIDNISVVVALGPDTCQSGYPSRCPSETS